MWAHFPTKVSEHALYVEACIIMASDVRTPLALSTVDFKPQERHEQYKRRVKLEEWICDYEIGIGEYKETGAVAVTVGGATFADPLEDYPTETLFANVFLAISSGAVKLRDHRMFWSSGNQSYKGPPMWDFAVGKPVV